MRRSKQMKRPGSDAPEVTIAQIGRDFFKWLTVPHALGMTLVLAYLWRNSVLTILLSGTSSVLLAATYLILGICFIYMLASRWNVTFAGIFLLLTCLPGSLASSSLDTTIPKSGGWALLVLAAGPVMLGGKARQLRSGAWTTLMTLAPAIGVTSCVWWVLRLPVLGVGPFTGVMAHANLVGPFSGLGVLVATCKALAAGNRPRLRWWFIAGASLIPCLISGCRIGVVGLAAGLMVVFMVRWDKVQQHLVVLILLGTLLGLGGYGTIMSTETASNMTKALTEKGLQNTRETVWEARKEEFRTHPYFGMGVGFGGGQGMMLDEEGKINAEPGSSYLAILSMTGLSGALGMGVLLLWAGWQWFQSSRLLPKATVSQLLSVGAFMGTNAIAEGWILAVGSPLCLLFWLWLGVCVDSSVAAETRLRKKPLLRRAVARTVPPRCAVLSPAARDVNITCKDLDSDSHN